MDALRTRFIRGLLIGYGIWHGLFILGFNLRYVYSISHKSFPLDRFIRSIEGYYLVLGSAGFLVFIGFLFKWIHYKNTLKKNPQLKSAVNDEMTVMNWMRAFRFAFFAMILGIPLLEITKLILSGAFGIVAFVTNTHLIFYIGVMACLAVFLHFDKKSS